jgi:hypothetical protein
VDLALRRPRDHRRGGARRPLPTRSASDPRARWQSEPGEPTDRRHGVGAFAILLVGLPFARATEPSGALALFDTFFRAGSLVFGGGHVVLPLLHGAVVDPGWVSNDRFLAGYGAAQAVPGPLFTFAAYLGAVANVGPGAWAGASIALVAIFAPSFLLIFGTLPSGTAYVAQLRFAELWPARTLAW